MLHVGSGAQLVYLEQMRDFDLRDKYTSSLCFKWRAHVDEASRDGLDEASVLPIIAARRALCRESMALHRGAAPWSSRDSLTDRDRLDQAAQEFSESCTPGASAERLKSSSSSKSLGVSQTTQI